jgi:hypothetical protein
MIRLSNLNVYFRGLPNKYPYGVKSDFHTSGIKGIIPEPYTKNQLHNRTDISDTLKNTVRNIMFNDKFK